MQRSLTSKYAPSAAGACQRRVSLRDKGNQAIFFEAFLESVGKVAGQEQAGPHQYHEENLFKSFDNFSSRTSMRLTAVSVLEFHIPSRLCYGHHYHVTGSCSHTYNQTRAEDTRRLIARLRGRRVSLQDTRLDLNSDTRRQTFSCKITCSLLSRFPALLPLQTFRSSRRLAQLQPCSLFLKNKPNSEKNTFDSGV